MKSKLIPAAFLLLAFVLHQPARAATADPFDGTWQITITSGTFTTVDGDTYPYTGSPGTITVTNGKVSGDTYGGQTSYSGTISNSGAANFTINIAGLGIQNFTGTFSGKSASGTFNETRPGTGTASGSWTATLVGGGSSGGGGGKKPKKDHRPIPSGWYYFTSTTLNPSLNIREHLSNGYAFIESTAKGGVIRAVFVPGGGSITSDPVAIAVNGGYATYSPGFVPLGDTTPGTEWGTVAPNPGTAFTGLDFSGTTYGFSGGLSWIANLNAFDTAYIGTPSFAPCSIGTGSGWDGVAAAFLRSGGLIETAVSGVSGNLYGLAYHRGNLGPPAGSLMIGGSATPTATPKKGAYALRSGHATIAGRVVDWPNKLKLHVKFSGGPAHARISGKTWKVNLAPPRSGRFVLTTWFTDSAGLRGKKARTIVTKSP